MSDMLTNAIFIYQLKVVVSTIYLAKSGRWGGGWGVENGEFVKM